MVSGAAGLLATIITENKNYIEAGWKGFWGCLIGDLLLFIIAIITRIEPCTLPDLWEHGSLALSLPFGILIMILLKVFEDKTSAAAVDNNSHNS